MESNLLLEYLKTEIKESTEILNSLGLKRRAWWDYPTIAAQGKRLSFPKRLAAEMSLQRGARAHQRLEAAEELARIFGIDAKDLLT